MEFDPRQLKERSIHLLMEASPAPIPVTFVYLLASQAIAWVQSRMLSGGIITLENLQNYPPEELLKKQLSEFTPFSAALILLLFAFTVILSFGYISYTLHIVRKQECDYFVLLDGFLVWYKSVLLYTVMRLIVAVLSIFLFVPGIIASHCYVMAPYLLTDHPDWSIWKCLSESRRMMKGNKMRLFKFHLSILVWEIMTLFFLSSIFATPFVSICDTVFYTELLPKESEAEEPEPWEY